MEPAQGRRFGRFELTSIDFFGADRSETLSQLIRRTEEESAAGDGEQDGNVLFGSMQGTVVGLRYYTGVVNPGEMISLVREPHNQYDSNAVMVANVFGSQVGHIRRQLAAPLAHVMDNRLAAVEGVVPYRANNAYTMPVQLFFWGKEENGPALKEELGRHGFKLGAAPKPKNEARLDGVQEMLPGATRKVNAIALTPEQLKNAFDKLFDDLMEDKTSETEPAPAIGTPLLPHQKQALAWMISRENNQDLPPFWERKNDLYFNALTNFSVRERPERVHGGVLADDMGLGKSLTTIALIVTNHHRGQPMVLDRSWESKDIGAGSSSRDGAEKGKSKGASEEGKGTPVKRCMGDGATIVISDSEDASLKKKVKITVSPMKSLSSPQKGRIGLLEDFGFVAALSGASPLKQKTKKKKDEVHTSPTKPLGDSGARATLIICPLSVLSNWLDQFEQHLKPDVNVNLYVYYGTDRSRDPKFLSRQDVVVTTYNTLSSDFANANSPLQKVSWLRVVLDEGHVVRNPNAQQSKAVLSLATERRWVLTGTPIQNSLKDLWMLMCFLKLKPFDIKEWWDRIIQRPVTLGDSAGLKNLQALVRGVTLRRTKNSKVSGRPVVELPEKKVFLQHVTMSETERQQYETVKAEGREVVGRYFRQGTVLKNLADVLTILLRLRQMCCHPQLVGKSAKAAGAEDPVTSDCSLRERLVKKITRVLSSGSDEECAVCLDSLREPVITYCAHVYCKPCICAVIRSEKEEAKCPLCRAKINTKELVEYPGDEHSDSDLSKDKWLSSSKVDALMEHLVQLRSQDRRLKSLVVSQFTRFLSLIEVPLREKGFKFTRLDGSMNEKARTKAIQAFQDQAQDSPTIMLLSLKAGGVGLNLTAASRVFLMEPAWNPAAEEQCFDRCHRLGQKNEVVITKFIMKNSVEETMMKLQKKKRKLVDKAFGVKSAQELKEARMEDIRALMDL